MNKNRPKKNNGNSGNNKITNKDSIRGCIDKLYDALVLIKDSKEKNEDVIRKVERIICDTRSSLIKLQQKNGNNKECSNKKKRDRVPLRFYYGLNYFLKVRVTCLLKTLFEKIDHELTTKGVTNLQNLGNIADVVTRV